MDNEKVSLGCQSKIINPANNVDNKKLVWGFQSKVIIIIINNKWQQQQVQEEEE